jgi:hypothetical protein
MKYLVMMSEDWGTFKSYEDAEEAAIRLLSERRGSGICYIAKVCAVVNADPNYRVEKIDDVAA